MLFTELVHAIHPHRMKDADEQVLFGWKWSRKDATK
jgi:hypothetical protein